MIDTNEVHQRIEQLQGERAALAESLRQLDAERQRLAHLLSAYDGGLGELQRVAEMAATLEPATEEGAGER